MQSIGGGSIVPFGSGEGSGGEEEGQPSRAHDGFRPLWQAPPFDPARKRRSHEPFGGLGRVPGDRWKA